MKYIGHLTLAGINYFFNIDQSVCLHTFTTVLMTIGISRLFFSEMAYVLYDGLLTVKEDALIIKEHLAIYAERLDQTDLSKRADKAIAKLFFQISFSNKY